MPRHDLAELPGAANHWALFALLASVRRSREGEQAPGPHAPAGAEVKGEEPVNRGTRCA